MKNIKLIIISILLIVSVTSCTENDNNSLEKSSKINTVENRMIIKELFSNEKSRSKLIKELGIDINNSNRDGDGDIATTETIDEYIQCSHCDETAKDFFYPMFQEFLDIQNEQIVARLDFYDSEIDTYTTNETERDYLHFTLYAFKESANFMIENRQFAGRPNSLGKDIGQGLVTGFITGCLSGAYTGATVGTVVVPVIGTVTGAVAGCFASGAVGAVIGAATNGFWHWINS